MQLVACVALLAALYIDSGSAATTAKSCAVASYGNLKGLRVPLRRINLLDRSNAISIANECPHGLIYVGMKIEVCDRFRSPDVIASSLHFARVYLWGRPGHAVADITEFCDRSAAGSQVDDVDDELPENTSPNEHDIDSDE